MINKQKHTQAQTHIRIILSGDILFLFLLPLRCDMSHLCWTSTAWYTIWAIYSIIIVIWFVWVWICVYICCTQCMVCRCLLYVYPVPLRNAYGMSYTKWWNWLLCASSSHLRFISMIEKDCINTYVSIIFDFSETCFVVPGPPSNIFIARVLIKHEHQLFLFLCINIRVCLW